MQLILIQLQITIVTPTVLNNKQNNTKTNPRRGLVLTLLPGSRT